MPAPCPHQGNKGILTGARRLACVSLVKTEGKVRTRPLCPRSLRGLILASSVPCFNLSYGGPIIKFFLYYNIQSVWWC